jgi:hypothetical protein
MSEADWKCEPSDLAIQAVSQAKEVGTKMAKSVEEAVTRGADQRREFMLSSAQRFGDANDFFAGGNIDDMHALLSFSSTSLGGLQDLQHCLSRLVEGVIRTNLRLVQEMFLVESPRAFAELHERFLREYFGAFQHGAAALIRAARQPEGQAAVM